MADEAEMKKFFDEVDTDGSGQVDASELKNIMAAMGVTLTDEECNAKLARIDKSGDGKISFEEFKATFE